MDKEPEITTVKYVKAPDRKEALHLLHEIAKKPILCRPRKVDKSLVLYGAGDLGKMAKEYFDKLGIPFLFVVDANPDRHRKDPFLGRGRNSCHTRRTCRSEKNSIIFDLSYWIRSFLVIYMKQKL